LTGGVVRQKGREIFWRLWLPRLIFFAANALVSAGMLVRRLAD
jgi:hypothetical protein